MHPKARAILAIAAIPFVVSSARAGSQIRLVNSHSIETYNRAAAYGGRGARGMAMALLEGILLTHTVRIGVEGDSVPDERREEYMSAVQASVRVWNQALPNVHLLVVDPGEKADVSIRFTHEIEDGYGREQGLIQVQRHYFWGSSSHGYRLSGRIQIKDTTFGQPLDGAAISRVLSHELGHLVGLGDDYEGSGVMAAFRSDEGRMSPSGEELRALQAFRSQLRETLGALAQRARDR